MTQQVVCEFDWTDTDDDDTVAGMKAWSPDQTTKDKFKRVQLNTSVILKKQHILMSIYQLKLR